ncbi:MAG: sigma-70 family RNA polymerase sigma factor [Xanthomonadales bacterium]|nr:sigma-70 family RNA polymerase sigma factor [Xanthomonadales bacterium]
MRNQLIQLGNGAHALALQMLGNTDDATDAVQDAFVKVLKKPGAYDANAGPLTPWFLRVVRNHCIDLIRRRRPEGANAVELSDPGPGPDSALEGAQRDQLLKHALARLSVEQRQIIVLRDYMDLSYAEIADVLEIAGGTVMSRLHRARMALKEELTSHG